MGSKPQLAALVAVLLVVGATWRPQAQSGPGTVAPALFYLIDTNKDAAVARDEFTAALSGWFSQWDAGKAGRLTEEQLLDGLSSAIPPPPPAPPPGPQNQTPKAEDVQAMMAALPDKAPAKPRQPRKVLVLAKAAGYVHSSIPLAARTVEEMGKKTGAWSATTTYDAADINEQNLKQYDAIFLVSTTGEFLDDPKDAVATAARRKAILDFVRGGKGLAGIHAASDSYHRTEASPRPPPAAGRAGRDDGRRDGAVATLATQFISQGDKNADKKLSSDELGALADAWFEKMDTQKAGRLNEQDFAQRVALVIPPPPPAPRGPTGFPVQARATQLHPDTEVGTWPEWNKLIGGFFKFHWNDGQLIHVRVDEPNHPLNAPFKGKPQLQIIDETYTFGRKTYTRENLRVLTSIDYDKMSAEDKAKEQNPRSDGDYALSWIRREGKGRVFYEAHGHNERVYANGTLLEHVMLGVQYVLGDLPAEDSPSVKSGAK